MNRAKQTGAALILTMILLLVLSVMAISLTFLSQTETWSSMNYRLMEQARDAAEAGVNKAANHLMFTYTAPGGVADPLTSYNMNASPVQYPAASLSDHDVILSADSNVESNYPVSSVQTAFNTASRGRLTAGNNTVTYTSSAKLLSMRQITIYGSMTPATIQTWLITATGSINGLRNAQVQVSAILERPIYPVFNYAAFATSPGCSALTFGGGGTTDSYDSTTVVNGSVTTQATSGNIGTNGNLTTSGNPTTINGTLSTPRVGVGTCTVNNITAWTDNQGTVTGGLVELPQPITFPTPVIPAPGTLNVSMNKSWDCKVSGILVPGCTSSGGDIYLPPGAYGDLSISGQANLHVSAGVYNINSFQEQSAQSGLIIDSGPVIFNVTGNNVSGSVVNLTGNSVQNATLVPTNFQILYAGTGSVSLKGNSQASGLLYAPNASFSFAGQGSWYGAVVGKTMTDMGGAAVHYDRRLQRTDYMMGNYMMSSFTWKKY